MELKQEPQEKHATAAAPGALAMKEAAAAVNAARVSSNSWRLSLPAGPRRSPKPAPRDRRTTQLLFSALAVTLTALPWERLWTGAAPVPSLTRPPFPVGNGRLLGGLISVVFILLWAAKVATEERLSAKARRRVAQRLEASFKLPSTVGTSWLRVWIGETVFGFGPVAVRAALGPENKEIARRSQNVSGVANVLAIEWVLLRFQLTSFMPWSDVRRISHVRAGGMAIHMTEAVNSASARRNVRSSVSGPGQSFGGEGSSRNIGDRSDRARRRERGNCSEQIQQEGEEDNVDRGANDGDTLSRINENEESSPRMGHERKDLWAHGARQAYQSSASSAATGSVKWDEDGFEWERIAQASLEYVLGHEFASKYKMYTEEAAGIIQRLSKIFFNLLKRYVIGEIVLQDMAVHLSPAVWRDLASAAIRWEGASVVRELLPAGGVEFRFDVTLSAQEMGCSSGSRTALEIVTALTKRTMLQLGRVVMWEAKRAIFNNESLVHIFVDSLILEGRGRAKAAKPDASAIAVACKTESGAASGKATFIGVLGQGVSTVAKRKRVAEVLNVLKHALFKAITIAAGGLDPDECNQPLTYLLSNAEISERFEWTDGESPFLLLGSVLKNDDEKKQEKDEVPGATRSRDPGVDDGRLLRPRRSNSTRFRAKNRSGNLGLGRSNLGVGKGRCALDVESVDGTNETLGRSSRGVDRIGGAHGGRGDVGGMRSRGFRDVEGEAIAVAAKLSAVIRKQDTIAALNTLRAVQVGPLLEELASSTAIGPAFRKLKIDVDYILTHAKGMTFGILLDQAIYQLEMAGAVGSQHLERLQGKASRDIIRLREKADMSSGAGGPPALSLDFFTAPMLAHAPGALGDAQKIAALAASFTRALASELTHDDLEATSTIFSFLKGIRARRAATNARAAAAAKVGSGGTGEDVGGIPPTAGGDPQKTDKDAKARTEAWNLEAEVELLLKDPAAMQSLRHVLERLAKLAKAGGVYVDVYFALSVLELAFGGLLQRIPKILPVVQTTIKRKGVTIKVSNLNLAGVDVPRNEIRVAFRGISLPPCGSIVETNTPFGRGRVLYYKKRSHSLCVELLSFRLTKGRHKFARAFVQPGDVVVVPGQDNVESVPITASPISTATPVANPEGVTTSAAAAATSSSSAALGGPARPGLGTEASSDSTASTHTRATTKTLLASAMQQLPGRFKQTGGDDGKRRRHLWSSLGQNVQPLPVRRAQHEAGGGLKHVEPSLADSDASFSKGARASSSTGGGDGDVGGTGDGNYTLASALDGGLDVNAAQVTGSTLEPSEEGWVDGEQSGMVSDSAGSPDPTGAESIASATIEEDIDQNRGAMNGSPRGVGTSSLTASTLHPTLHLGSTDAKGSGLEKSTGLADVRQPSPLPPFLRIPSAAEISREHPDTGGALASSRGQTSSVFIDEKRTEYYGAGGGGTSSSGISGPHKGGIDGSISRSQTPAGTNVIGEHFPKEAANSTPKVINSGRDAWKKITAVAAQGVGEASKGVPWVKKVAARGVGRGSGNRRQLRGQSRKEDDDPRETGKETSVHQGTYGGNEPGANGKAPLLSIQIGGVNGDLPDVHWSVQIQQKILKVEDSGRVNVKVKGVSLSVSLDPGAGASSLPPLQRPPSAPSPQSSPTTATPQSSPFCREDDIDSLSRASSSPISVTPAGLVRQTSGLVDDDLSGGSAGRSVGQPQEGDARDMGPSAGVEGVRDALGDTGAEVNDVTVTDASSPPATDLSVTCPPPVSCTYESASESAPASRDAGGPNFPDSATSVRPGDASSLSFPVAEGSGGGLDTFPPEVLLDNAPEGTRTAAYGGSGPRRATIGTLSSALTKGTGKLRRRLKGPVGITTISPPETPLCSPFHHDRSDGFTTPTRPTPSQYPLYPGAASKAVKPLSEFVPVRESFIGALKNDGGSREAGGERSRASPGVSESSEDDKLACSIGYGSAGLLKVTECRCSVGTIDIQIDGSKCDGIYNFLAKGLGDTIRDAVREAVEKAFTQEVERLVARINDRAAQLWCGIAPEPKKPAKVVCTAIRAQGIGKGRIEPFVKLRLFDKDGSQVAKRSTAALTSIAGAADASDRGGISRNPCWIGLDNDLTLDLPEEGAEGYSLFFEVRHSGTLASNLIGSTRRSTLREIEARVAEKRGENANIDPELCWDIDTGGKLTVRLSISGLAPLRSKKPSKVGLSYVSEITPAVDGDSSTISRRLA